MNTLEHSESSASLVKEALRVAWPAVTESFFVALAGMIDTLMVSTLGPSAVAAIGLTTQPKFIVLSFFIATNIALSALIARRRGEGRQNHANEIFLTALLYTVGLCVLLTSICLVFASPLIRLCGSAEDTHGLAVTYYRIIMGGGIFNVLSMVINAAQRGSGNTRIAMRTNLTSSAVNVCFNYLLIGGHFGFPALGITGAAIATVLGTVVACGMSIQSLFRTDSFLRIPLMLEQKIRPTIASLKQVIKLSANFVLESLLMRVGFMATALMGASLGTEAFAVHNVGMNFLTLGFAFGDGMQASAVALIGRSLGEGNKQKARRYGNVCQGLGLVMSVSIALIMLFGGRFLFSLFFREESAIAMGMIVSWYLIATVVFQIAQVIFAGSLRAAGDIKFILFSSLISVSIVRTAVTIVAVKVLGLGIAGLWMGILADQLARFITLTPRFYQGKWMDMVL